MVVSNKQRPTGNQGRTTEKVGVCLKTNDTPTYGQYYVYNSVPKLSHSDRPKHKTQALKKSASHGICQPSHATNIRTRGAHEFYNMMWDPTVYRGNCFKTFGTAETDRFTKKRKEDAAQVKTRKYPRQEKKFGGVVRPPTASDEQAEKVGFEDMGLQTDLFLEEITTVDGKKDMCTQADGFLRKATEREYQPFMFGLSQKCQTDPQLSFPFEENMAYVQKELTNKILEQSLFETTEEVELEALRKEKRGYIQWRREELYKCKRIADAQRAVTNERALAVELRLREAESEEEAEGRLGAALFSSRCIAGIMPITFSILKIEGFMPETGSQDIYALLMPWMDAEVLAHYKEKKLMSRKILDDMLRKVTSDKEPEVVADIVENMLGTLGTPEQNEEEYYDRMMSFAGEDGPIRSSNYSKYSTVNEVGFGEEHHRDSRVSRVSQAKNRASRNSRMSRDM